MEMPDMNLSGMSHETHDMLSNTHGMDSNNQAMSMSVSKSNPRIDTSPIAESELLWILGCRNSPPHYLLVHYGFQVGNLGLPVPLSQLVLDCSA